MSVSNKAAGQRIATIMRDAVPLRIPVVVDAEYGPNWGKAKTSIEEW
jgi:DNA polymerase I-like protein with 3'-5' exonuclease and polymerase domains